MAGTFDLVMPGLVPGIHVVAPTSRKTWMAGTSPAMTKGQIARYVSGKNVYAIRV
jgi:hypothetical protein